MKIITSKNEWLTYADSLKARRLKIGLVPTMGALHQGHFSLIEKAEKECDVGVVSIFINPTQFDNNVDLQKYPKNLDNDLELLSQKFANLVVFAPSTEELYGSTLVAEHFDFDGLENKMEGASRKGHFDGVGTVLKKLFQLILPQKAYFGEKDYQQLLIVNKLVDLLQLPIEIVGCPIYRESNGLALSSRNERLTLREKEEATLLYNCLLKAKNEFGTKTATAILNEVREEFKSHKNFKLDYFEIADAYTLDPAQAFEAQHKYRAFIAAYLGEVRLIDNMALN